MQEKIPETLKMKIENAVNIISQNNKYKISCLFLFGKRILFNP
ncbi:MAG: hypothetical protein ACI85O_002365 [Saprospiraceae bacterium]|jgi:hypothetical protein